MNKQMKIKVIELNWIKLNRTFCKSGLSIKTTHTSKEIGRKWRVFSLRPFLIEGRNFLHYFRTCTTFVQCTKLSRQMHGSVHCHLIWWIASQSEHLSNRIRPPFPYWRDFKVTLRRSRILVGNLLHTKIEDWNRHLVCRGVHLWRH